MDYYNYSHIMDKQTRLYCLLIEFARMNPDDEPTTVLQLFEEVLLEQDGKDWDEIRDYYWKLYHLGYTVGQV